MRRDAKGGGVELDLTLGGGGCGGDGDPRRVPTPVPRRVPRRPHGEMISILGSVALATAAGSRGYVEVFLRRLTAASAAAEVRWEVGARVERGGIGAASRAGRVPEERWTRAREMHASSVAPPSEAAAAVDTASAQSSRSVATSASSSSLAARASTTQATTT